MERKKKSTKKVKDSKTKVKYVLALLLIIVVFLQIFFLLGKNKSHSFPNNSPESGWDIVGYNLSRDELVSHAERIVDVCEDVEYRPVCYDREIPELMKTMSMEDAFEVTREIQNLDDSYLYCHVLGHELSAREARKDIDNWKKVIGRCPPGLCSNGCLHGAFQERFRTDSLPDAEIEELLPELNGVCEKRDDWNPTGLERGSCYHALGHLTMYITDADIEKSIALCDKLLDTPEKQGFKHLCYDGLFMQIHQPLEPEDFVLVEGKQPTKEEIPEYCAPYKNDTQVYGSCWTESWPLFYDEIKTSDGLKAFCRNLSDPAENRRCYTASFYILTPHFNFDEEKISVFCMGLDSDIKGQCFANASSRMIETDFRNITKSVHLCSVAEESGVGEECYEELLLYSTYNFHRGSDEFYKLCDGLPSMWRDKCLAR